MDKIQWLVKHGYKVTIEYEDGTYLVSVDKCGHATVRAWYLSLGLAIDDAYRTTKTHRGMVPYDEH